MQTVWTIIESRVLRHLSWVCTVCVCPFYGTLGLTWLMKLTLGTRPHVSACVAGSRLISYEDITRFNIFTMYLTLSMLTTDDISVFCLAFPTEWGSWRTVQVVSKGGGWHGVSGAILWNREILPIYRLLN